MMRVVACVIVGLMLATASASAKSKSDSESRPRIGTILE
jgi:hypothetical protein